MDSAKDQPQDSKPPPIPPRPAQRNVTSINNSYASPLGMNPLVGGYGYGSGMGFGGYGAYSGLTGMGGYGGYGGYGYGGIGGYGGYGRMGLYGHNTGPDDSNDFIRLAEESSRQAFQSIESIVHAFASVSMMLESTYFAVHSSFRAVLGVADHFSKLRGHMAHVISSLAIIKTLNWFLRRIAFLMGVTRVDPNDERIWSEAELSASLSPADLLNGAADAASGLQQQQRKSQSWPILIFFAVVFGTPWLIWKLLLRISGPTTAGGQQQQDGEAATAHWITGEGEHYVAKGLYDFQTDRTGEVAFTAGQQLRIAPKWLQPAVRGWILASDGKNVGLVPTSYITIIEMKSGVQQQEPDSQTGNH